MLERIPTDLIVEENLYELGGRRVESDACGLRGLVRANRGSHVPKNTQQSARLRIFKHNIQVHHEADTSKVVPPKLYIQVFMNKYS
jgi:hypothetical protein